MEDKENHVQTNPAEINVPYHELLLMEIKAKTTQNDKLKEKIKSFEEHIEKNNIKCREYTKEYTQCRQTIANRMENAYITMISYENKLSPYASNLKNITEILESYSQNSQLSDSILQQLKDIIPNINNTINQYDALIKYDTKDKKDMMAYSAYRAANIRQINLLLSDEA